MTVIAGQFLWRRGTAASWASTNPVLGAGEPGMETDTNKFKLGNGSAAWNALPYQGGTGGGASPVASVQGRIGAVTVTAADVGLGAVNNTADATKPVSGPQQAALNAKAPVASPTLTGTTSVADLSITGKVTGLTPSMVGLSNTQLDAIIASLVGTAGSATRAAISALLGGTTTSTLLNSAAPTISGGTAVGSVLTAGNGTWSATPDSYAWVWRRGGTAIAGATASTYTTTSADVGAQITVSVTAYKSGFTSATALSGAVTVAAVQSTNPPVTTNYTASTVDFPNPERGFFLYSETHYKDDGSNNIRLDATALASSRVNSNQSVVFRYYVMERFRSQTTIDQTWLDQLQADLTACRTAGVKMLPRFCYSTAGTTSPPINDAPAVGIVSGHQASIAAVLNANKDVIAAVQCGLIGMWGEWYYTDLYGNAGTVTDAQWTDRMTVLNNWLSRLDSSIPVLVRYAGIKIKRFGQSTTDPLAARVGFHNDAFLAPYADYGTYTTFSPLDEATTRAYLSNETLTVPMNGESATGNDPVSNGTNAKIQLAASHWDLLNPSYNMDVLNSWSSAERAEINLKLGYRLALTNASWPAVAPGAAATVSVTLTNVGYAAPRHEKTLYVTVGDGTNFVRTALSGSIRTIQPGGSATFSTTVTAPSTAGTYTLHLEIVDPNLPTRGEYAIRLANPEVTYTATRNQIGLLAVTGSGGGGSTTTSALLLESGSRLLLESGDALLLG